MAEVLLVIIQLLGLEKWLVTELWHRQIMDTVQQTGEVVLLIT